MGDNAPTLESYEGFLNIWKDADPDLPVYRPAKAEYAPPNIDNQTRGLLHLSRQGEMKGCTSSVVGCRPQPATMRLHNVTTDG